MAEAVKCGIINLGNGIMPIVCIKDTGDLVVIDDLMGDCYISEITVEDPIFFSADESTLERMNCIGMVICESGMYLFDEDKYRFYEITDLNHVALESVYDTSGEYTGEDLDWQ